MKTSSAFSFCSVDLSRAFASITLVTMLGCGTRFGAVYPSRPSKAAMAPLPDPAPTRVVAHVAVSGTSFRSSIDGVVPKTGKGTFPFVRGDRNYEWTRDPFAVSFSQGRVVLDTHVAAVLDMPLVTMNVLIDVKVLAEPVVNSDYLVKLQSTDVQVTSMDRRVKVADAVADVLPKIAKEIDAQLKAFSQDLKPLIGEAYARVKKPYEFPLGDAKGCAELRVLGVEAGPTVLADGIEKDLALIVAPQVTLPCSPANDTSTLPPLSNVAAIPSGPFTVTIPIAATYDELAKAMSMTFTDGKYFFSKEFYKLYMTEPEVYASDDQLVLKLRIRGPVHKFGFDEDLDGDLFLTGHPTLVDNELTIPDLEPTIETKSFLLKLKAMADGDGIRDQARKAMRLNLTERFVALKTQLKDSLEFGQGDACFRGAVDRIEVTGVYPHANYLRVVTAITGRARLAMPCP